RTTPPSTFSRVLSGRSGCFRGGYHRMPGRWPAPRATPTRGSLGGNPPGGIATGLGTLAIRAAASQDRTTQVNYEPSDPSVLLLQHCGPVHALGGVHRRHRATDRLQAGVARCVV